LKIEYFPKVSIITVCYNRVDSIEKTIQSVLNQTYSNIEYIVIDGGSDDGTVDIIKKYQQNIAFWVSEKDAGISDAFNKGLAKVSGEIVGIINSDDCYAAYTVEQVVNVFATNPGFGFVFGDQLFVDQHGNILFTQKGDPGYQRIIKYEMPSIPHPTVFVRSQIYQECGGFDKLYQTAMDYEFLLRIYKHGFKGYYLPQVLAYMRLSGESDINYIRGYRESRKISIRYGYNKPIAWVRYYYKCVKTFTRKRFEKTGMQSLVRLFRTHLGHRYRY
jgi:glycosyltransferase involved in cell wall biosynthesis